MQVMGQLTFKNSLPNLLSKPKTGWMQTVSDGISQLFYLPFGIVYLLIIYFFLFLILSWIKLKKVHWLKTILWLMVVLQLIIATAAAQAEFQRIFLEAIPAVVLLLAFFIQQVVYAIHYRQLSFFFYPNNNSTAIL
jgi:hypothetical protein